MSIYVTTYRVSKEHPEMDPPVIRSQGPVFWALLIMAAALLAGDASGSQARVTFCGVLDCLFDSAVFVDFPNVAI